MTLHNQAYLAWCSEALGASLNAVVPLAGDASLRTFYRVYGEQGQSWILMDCHKVPQQCHAFVKIAAAYAAHHIPVPTVYHWCQTRNWLLVTDLGDTTFFQKLSQNQWPQLYNQAMSLLPMVTRVREIPDYHLPMFDEIKMLEEMNLFITWYLQQYLKVSVSSAMNDHLQIAFQVIVDAIKQQPYVGMHRDFHSRNLMLRNDCDLYVIDFQDAMLGPIAYDLASLLGDCYFDVGRCYPQFIADYQQLLCDEGILRVDVATLTEWTKWCQLQRYIKCLGLFVRLSLRDGKKQFLDYLPRLGKHVISVCQVAPKLRELAKFIKSN